MYVLILSFWLYVPVLFCSLWCSHHTPTMAQGHSLLCYYINWGAAEDGVGSFWIFSRWQVSVGAVSSCDVSKEHESSFITLTPSNFTLQMLSTTPPSVWTTGWVITVDLLKITWPFILDLLFRRCKWKICKNRKKKCRMHRKVYTPIWGGFGHFQKDLEATPWITLWWHNTALLSHFKQVVWTCLIHSFGSVFQKSATEFHPIVTRNPTNDPFGFCAFQNQIIFFVPLDQLLGLLFEGGFFIIRHDVGIVVVSANCTTL